MDLDRDPSLPPRQRRRQQPDSVDDIEHIQALLHGAPGELGSVPSAAILASNAPAGVGRRQQSQARPPPAAAVPPAPPGPRSALPPNANAGPSAPPDTSRFAVPGPRSTATALHCEACDCFVPVSAGRRAAAAAAATATATTTAASAAAASSSSSPSSASSLPASWRDHVAGIRHSRAALGAAMSGGVPGTGAVAVSVFEDEEEATRRRQRQQRQQRQRQTQERESSYQEQQRLRQEIDDSFQPLRTECLKELLRHCGVTDGGRELARRFSCPGLSQALTELIQAMCNFSMQRWSARQGGGGGGGFVDLLGSMFSGGGIFSGGGGSGGAWREELLVPMATPALVAVLAFLLRGSLLPENGWTGGETTGIGDWWLAKHQGGDGEGGRGSAADDSDYDAGGPRPPSPALFISLAPVHERDLPAVTAACALLARSLADNDGLKELTIDGRRLPRAAAPPPPPPPSSSSAAGGGSLVPRREEQRLWGLVAGELNRSLRCNDALETVKLSLPRLSLGAEDARELAATAAGAREARRRAFLSAAHPRCCRTRGDGEEGEGEGALSTPLSMLPMDLMVVIAGMGIKRGPCRFELEEV